MKNDPEPQLTDRRSLSFHEPQPAKLVCPDKKNCSPCCLFLLRWAPGQVYYRVASFSGRKLSSASSKERTRFLEGFSECVFPSLIALNSFCAYTLTQVKKKIKKLSKKTKSMKLGGHASASSWRIHDSGGESSDSCSSQSSESEWEWEGSASSSGSSSDGWSYGGSDGGGSD